MPGVLGNQSMPSNILGRGYGTPRQVRMMPQSQPIPIEASPFAMMGGGPGMGPSGGSDPRDAPGSGVSLMRELMRGLSKYGIGALATNRAGDVFSPENRALLDQNYQKQGKGK